MFENSLLLPSGRRKAISLGYLLEGALLALVALIPLIHVEALPSQLTSVFYVPPPPPRPAPAERFTARIAVRLSRRDLMAAPATIPNRIVQLADRPETAIEQPAVGVPGSVPWGSADALAGSIPGAISPPPPAPHSQAGVARLHVGGAVEAARLVFQPKPEYPQIARMARLQGTVRLAATISAQGVIQSLQVLSGPPLLVKAATDAVARWRYQPTLLNGEPVEVSTEIDVNFVLGE